MNEKNKAVQYRDNTPLLKILRSGNKRFTVEDIEKLNMLPIGNTISLQQPEPKPNSEQKYYNFLKTYMTDSLINRANAVTRSIYNKEIELHMIRNILINRGYDVSNLAIKVDTYNRFVPNTKEENKLYGLRGSDDGSD
jgi:hypothetical protein